MIPNLQERFFKSMDGVFCGLYYDPKSGNYLVAIASDYINGGGSSVSILDRETHQDFSKYIGPQQIKWETHEVTRYYTFPNSLLLKSSSYISSSNTSGFSVGEWYQLAEPESKIHIAARFDRKKVSDPKKEEAHFFDAEFNEATQSWSVVSRFQPSWP